MKIINYSEYYSSCRRKMVKRDILEKLKKYLKLFPVVAITGVRQCGKSTMLREFLPDYGYVSLEDPDIRDLAISDPKGFLDAFKAPCIFDEAQRVPELFSYIQTRVDADGTMGEYILSCSHNSLLMQSIAQNLAERTGLLTLAPLSLKELKNSGLLAESVDEIMLNGCYPAIYDRGISQSDYFPSYVQTYIEGDVRLLRNVPDASAFIRFVRLCAARSGQMINYSELSNACGVSVPTVRAWLSVLIQSYIVFELPPYYNNYSKRLVKSPKLYFYDTGLLCYLLGIESVEQLAAHELRGAIFETLMVSEYMKSRFFAGKEPAGYYWRDSNQNEVDLLTEDAGKLRAYEIKAGATMNRKYLKALSKFSEISGIPGGDCACIYTGARSVKSDKGSFLRFTDAFI